jgi:hypothetical protein
MACCDGHCAIRHSGSRAGRRGGAVLVVALVCLGVAAVVFVLMVKQAGEERRAIQTGQQRIQALWLAEAGVERAAARLAADSTYAGETWTIPAEQLAGEGGAVRIHVEAMADQPERRAVRVEADYPDFPAERCRQVKQVIVDREVLRSH